MALGLGLDVGGTKILACAIAESGAVVAEARTSSPRDRDGLLDALDAAARALYAALGPRAREVVAVGAGIPSLVDAGGVLHETPNLPAIEGFALLDALRGRLVAMHGELGGGTDAHLDIIVENDATAAAAGELAFGAARQVRNAVVVTLGTGIGGGIVADGRILHGERGFAGEVGHMVVELDGPRCHCGGRGCWEQYASGTGLARLGRAAVARGAAPGLAAIVTSAAELRGEHVVAAASAGDEGARAIVDTFARYLALGLSNLAEIFDPARLILGGGLVRSAGVLFEALPGYFAEHRRGTGARRVEVVTAARGERAGAVGAAALALGVVR